MIPATPGPKIPEDGPEPEFRPEFLRIANLALNAAFNGQGACDDSNGGAAGWRRSAELPEGGGGGVDGDGEMKDVIGDGSKRWRENE